MALPQDPVGYVLEKSAWDVCRERDGMCPQCEKEDGFNEKRQGNQIT